MGRGSTTPTETGFHSEPEKCQMDPLKIYTPRSVLQHPGDYLSLPQDSRLAIRSLAHNVNSSLVEKQGGYEADGSDKLGQHGPTSGLVALQSLAVLAQGDLTRTQVNLFKGLKPNIKAT